MRSPASVGDGQRGLPCGGEEVFGPCAFEHDSASLVESEASPPMNADTRARARARAPSGDASAPIRRGPCSAVNVALLFEGTSALRASRGGGGLQRCWDLLAPGPPHVRRRGASWRTGSFDRMVARPAGGGGRRVAVNGRMRSGGALPAHGRRRLLLGPADGCGGLVRAESQPLSMRPRGNDRATRWATGPITRPRQMRRWSWSCALDSIALPSPSRGRWVERCLYTRRGAGVAGLRGQPGKRAGQPYLAFSADLRAW